MEEKYKSRRLDHCLVKFDLASGTLLASTRSSTLRYADKKAHREYK